MHKQINNEQGFGYKIKFNVRDIKQFSKIVENAFFKIMLCSSGKSNSVLSVKCFCYYV